MRIGELSRLSGITPHAIRFYEREGLLAAPARTPGGYRDYGPEALKDLRFIAKAQSSGLRLSDIREVLQIASGGRQPCQHVRATVQARLAEVDRRVRELRALRAALRATLRRLETAPAAETGCRCAAIESVSHPLSLQSGRRISLASGT